MFYNGLRKALYSAYIVRVMALLLPFFVGCDLHRDVEYSAVYDFDEGWRGDQALIFKYDNSAKYVSGDSGVGYGAESDIFLMVRTARQYKYSSVLVEFRCVDPDRLYWTDTLRLPISRTSRRFSGFSDSRFLYRSSVRLTKAGEYSFSVHQLMADSTAQLEGLEAFGVEIVRR